MADIQEGPQARNQQLADWGSISQSFQDIAARTALIANALAFNQKAEARLDQPQLRVAAHKRQLGDNTQRLRNLEGKQTALRRDVRKEISQQ